MRVGVMTVLYHGLALDGGARPDRRARRPQRRARHGQLRRQRARRSRAAAGRRRRARRELRDALAERAMEISALSQHGNPLHPDPAIAGAHHATWRRTLELAECLEVDTVVAFSGCPGDGPGAARPNWVTCPWPPDFLEILEWQWSERVAAVLARRGRARARRPACGSRFEMHPGMIVYNPRDASSGCAKRSARTSWRATSTRATCSGRASTSSRRCKTIGRAGALAHVHAKDTALDAANIARNGVLDTKPYARRAGPLVGASAPSATATARSSGGGC